jgi:hypothetical protein
VPDSGSRPYIGNGRVPDEGVSVPGSRVPDPGLRPYIGNGRVPDPGVPVPGSRAPEPGLRPYLGNGLVPDAGVRVPRIRLRKDQPTPQASRWGDGLPTTGFPARTSHGSVNFASTGGICFNGTLQLGAMGGVTGCILVDARGFGWSGAVKDGAGPAAGANANISVMFSTADRMEKMNGPQLVGGIEAGELLTGGLEFDSGSDLTVQGGLGVGANISEVGPISGSGGVSLNSVNRWDWATWGK